MRCDKLVFYYLFINIFLFTTVHYMHSHLPCYNRTQLSKSLSLTTVHFIRLRSRSLLDLFSFPIRSLRRANKISPYISFSRQRESSVLDLVHPQLAKSFLSQLGCFRLHRLRRTFVTYSSQKCGCNLFGNDLLTLFL